MSVMVTVEIPVQAGKMGAFLEFVVQALPATRAFDGCLKVEAFVEDGERSLVLVEMWETLGHQTAYMKWRMETGLADALAPFASGPPPSSEAISHLMLRISMSQPLTRRC